MVEVWVPANLRRFCSGSEHIELTGASIGELLADLVERFPALGERVVDDRRQLRSHLMIIRGDEILKLDGLHEIRLRDREKLRLFGAAAGG